MRSLYEYQVFSEKVVEGKKEEHFVCTFYSEETLNEFLDKHFEEHYKVVIKMN